VRKNSRNAAGSGTVRQRPDGHGKRELLLTVTPAQENNGRNHFTEQHKPRL